MECLKSFIASPTNHLNDLNAIIPAIIEKNDVKSATKLVKAIIESDLVQ